VSVSARVHLNSAFARGLLARRPDVIAVTIGARIFVVGDMIPSWVMRHEIQHVRQYLRYGLFGFLARYAWYMISAGYSRNPLEHDAEEAE